MKTGKTLQQLAAELDRQNTAKKDFIVDSHRESLRATSLTHRQIAQHLGVPQAYYDRIGTEVPDLRAATVNRLFKHQPATRMVRTLDSQARAFLSNRYRPLDNFDLAQHVLPVITADMPGATIMSCELTSTRMYIKVVNPRVQLEVKKGDPVQAGVIISNSEVTVQPLVFRLVCLNGMISEDHSVKQQHVGRAITGADNDDTAFGIYRDDTLRQDDKALFMKVQDTVKAAVQEAKFKMIVDRLHESTEKRIEGDPVAATEVVAKRYGFNDDERSNVLKHLITGGDLSMWGVANAVTRTSQDLADYDRATEFEKVGGKIIDLTASDWKEIATAKN